MSGNTFARIRKSLPQGFVLGRQSSGTGPVEAIHISDLASLVVATGVAAGSGGSGQLWNAGNVGALDASLVITNGTLGVTALLGVTAIGSGLTIVGGKTLEATGGGSARAYAPLVTGDTLGYIGLTKIYGPYPIIDPSGQFIMVPIT
jgi:hypothetical protein